MVALEHLHVVALEHLTADDELRALLNVSKNKLIEIGLACQVSSRRVEASKGMRATSLCELSEAVKMLIPERVCVLSAIFEACLCIYSVECLIPERVQCC